jgi:hypothetical protein
MPPIHAIKNQYAGVNAHLHSYWQKEGGWDSFHANHIADLMRLMGTQLLPMGYIADIQQSLQIRHLGEAAGKPESDVTIYDTDPARPWRGFSWKDARGKALPLAEMLHLEPELTPYHALAIYEYLPPKRDPGEPVAWIELLSPSNKPGGQDAAYYQDKRRKLLQSGIVFVEIDYLHESPPTFDVIPLYLGTRYTEQPVLESHPYRIAVVDPRPQFTEGKVYLTAFDVDEPIPTVTIPLNAQDTLDFDFGKAYNKTIEETLYGAILIDYEQQPANFDRYTRGDQARILARMLTIVQAVRKGVSLEENAPLPIDPEAYDDDIGRIKWKD